MQKLTVSIVTYNAGEDIRRCLQSLKAQTFKNFDVIIVDNASKDQTVATVKEVYLESDIYQLKENVGFGAGHNIAISHSQNDWILILNQDVVLRSDALQKLISHAEKDDLASVGPCLYRAKDEKEIDTTGLEKTWYYNVSDRGAGKKVKASSGYVWGNSGSCVLLRKKALDDIAYQRKDRNYPEYFDENFFMYKEDVDLAARLQRKGWKAWYESEAIGYHNRTGGGAQSIAQTRAHRKNIPQHVPINSYRNHLFFLLKNMPLISLLPVAVYELLKLVYLLIFERRILEGVWKAKDKFNIMWSRRYV